MFSIHAKTNRIRKALAAPIVVGVSSSFLLFSAFSLTVIEITDMTLHSVPIPFMWGCAVWLVGGMVIGAFVLPAVLRALSGDLVFTNLRLPSERHTVVSLTVTAILLVLLYLFGLDISRFLSLEESHPDGAVALRGFFLTMGLLLFSVPRP